MFVKPFSLSGLHCESCIKLSEMKISDIPGVVRVHLERRGNEADGDLEAERDISLEEIQQSLADTSYRVSAR
ncbi:MAG: heavy-metal-associated domain-containing protein [Parcubacteria group bacterium]|nr:heavy-metal-associated domain-containing protein [Parcubacteria group bacterium]